MSRETPGDGAYAIRVREDTRRYVQQLLACNEELRAIVSGLEQEKCGLEERLLALQQVRSENGALRSALAALEHELELLREHLTQARDEAARREGEKTRLQQSLAALELESRRFSDEYVEIEQQITNLANLYVASCRIHESLKREEVLLAVQEIIANLLGSEQAAVFELTEDGSALRLAAGWGLPEGAPQRIPLGAGPIGRVAASGERLFLPAPLDGETAGLEADLTACVPLRFEERITGVLAVFRLLAHKPGLNATDHELLELISTHAATALHAAALQERFQDTAFTARARAPVGPAHTAQPR